MSYSGEHGSPSASSSSDEDYEIIPPRVAPRKIKKRSINELDAKLANLDEAMDDISRKRAKYAAEIARLKAERDAPIIVKVLRADGTYMTYEKFRYNAVASIMMLLSREFNVPYEGLCLESSNGKMLYANSSTGVSLGSIANEEDGNLKNLIVFKCYTRH